jgi:hypothetical protein
MVARLHAVVGAVAVAVGVPPLVAGLLPRQDAPGVRRLAPLPPYRLPHCVSPYVDRLQNLARHGLPPAGSMPREGYWPRTVRYGQIRTNTPQDFFPHGVALRAMLKRRKRYSATTHRHRRIIPGVFPRLSQVAHKCSSLLVPLLPLSSRGRGLWGIMLIQSPATTRSNRHEQPAPTDA